ncbi:CCA tRNA nucleotidyltransferase [Sulfitobacter mediterraneus]|uniref:CCA tRNA nucleotidyltransferase n=2 Tax=Sulfitobacter mediterraneus TaxID=83219 RepID=UPI00193A964E|nr:CCA tRNA nucleotidyltransferase [Sulfitobacter mediterraneus]MBM1555400.1 CCA tRNA nucleotidyltransferase [Sulfitobacter mediterraneus]MBM1567047.1 CCA tRNA nucleotidyltransferase [Sulfitobacter mediterraneus]MBM1570849.1 CCA tRNA nucleotidyltransferase [Sulfitobacter mediterraneus]MBM1574649.1 CCA tRNA nucleotidyltransferase [Sulfitobacter mediterraneus]MBM1578358.1 CCA tRNA nucleotidyltransferase [Sulfitobacter mediterraneus]
MVKSNDIVIPPGTSWLMDKDAQAVCRVIQEGGYQIFYVGGCVRNALLGVADSDVDMSTDALPEKVMQLAGDAGMKAIPTGIDHGTVTVVAGGKPFEITTFRRDVQTDGRRAVVAFSKDIADDARRRDFTMNALYCDALGNVFDPLSGLPDLLARRIRFIEDPAARIQEDYLRILRFFRFSAWFGDQQEGFDVDALAAISSNTHGLETLSAERVGQEMTKLLAAPDPAPAVAAMRQTGVLHALLPGSDDRWLAVLVHMEGVLGLDLSWLTRLAVLGGDDPAVRLRLSKADNKQLALLREAGFSGPPLPELAYRHGAEMAQQALLLRSVLAESLPDLSVLETILEASTKVFPLKAADLMPAFSGPALGQRLKRLEQAWVNSGFALSRTELLQLP